MTLAARARHWLPLLPLLGLLAVTYWLDQQVRPEAQRVVGPQRHEPDAVMENFSAIKMNELGKPGFVMSASRMLHFPDDDTALLEMPRLTSLAAGRPPVHVAARQGEVSGNGEEVRLRGEVEVMREAGQGRAELTLQTDVLRVLPERDWADTDRPVTLFDGRTTVEAVGMEMDNRARTVKLLSQVRSVHE